MPDVRPFLVRPCARRHDRRRALGPAALAMLVTGGLAVPAGADAASLRASLDGLPSGAESRTGYDRGLFRHWIDADGDGCDTREEVLIAEATTRPTTGSGCALTGGRWTSYYDGATWTAPSDLDIDHVVPLAEAWDSGASAWSAARRERFANDVGDARSLEAVTDNVNQAKGDQDPAEWLPPASAARCRYVTSWVAVKTRWTLRVDAAERSRLDALVDGCPNVELSVSKAS